MELSWVIVSLCIAFYIGKKYGEFTLYVDNRELFEKHPKFKEVNKDTATYSMYVLEKINNYYYLYNKKNNSFVFQAPTFTEIVEKFSSLNVDMAGIEGPEESLFWFEKGKFYEINSGENGVYLTLFEKTNSDDH